MSEGVEARFVTETIIQELDEVEVEFTVVTVVRKRGFIIVTPEQCIELLEDPSMATTYAHDQEIEYDELSDYEEVFNLEEV